MFRTKSAVSFVLLDLLVGRLVRMNYQDHLCRPLALNTTRTNAFDYRLFILLVLYNLLLSELKLKELLVQSLFDQALLDMNIPYFVHCEEQFSSNIKTIKISC